MTATLSTTEHDRNIAGLKYIYPVMSRRAGGLSIGINFNPNNACNWRCLYCQVPNLVAGNAPEMDFKRLEHELRHFLDYVQHGTFFQDFKVIDSQQIIKDIAISGNGEPTSLKNFSQAIQLIGDIASGYGIFPNSKFVVISNGSLLHQSNVQNGLKTLASFQGELWFKLDSATVAGRKLINNTGQSQQKLLQNLQIASSLCHTKLQTCMLHYRQQLWTDNEKQVYLQLLVSLQQQQISIQKIMLYSIARQSYQPEAEELRSMPSEEMHTFATEIAALGYEVSVSD
ncbi:radical SAM protein [Methylomonas sp. AM2-LC]|uniref:radical SAM protein n=1 Tax=Methylomonas sp. AM2-LC TaxID=3153301 RepID=UPI0032641CCF